MACIHLTVELKLKKKKNLSVLSERRGAQWQKIQMGEISFPPPPFTTSNFKVWRRWEWRVEEAAGKNETTDSDNALWPEEGEKREEDRNCSNFCVISGSS